MIVTSYNIVFLNYELVIVMANFRLPRHAFGGSKIGHRNVPKQALSALSSPIPHQKCVFLTILGIKMFPYLSKKGTDCG